MHVFRQITLVELGEEQDKKIVRVAFVKNAEGAAVALAKQLDQFVIGQRAHGQNLSDAPSAVKQRFVFLGRSLPFAWAAARLPEGPNSRCRDREVLLVFHGRFSQKGTSS